MNEGNLFFELRLFTTSKTKKSFYTFKNYMRIKYIPYRSHIHERIWKSTLWWTCIVNNLYQYRGMIYLYKRRTFYIGSYYIFYMCWVYMSIWVVQSDSVFDKYKVFERMSYKILRYSICDVYMCSCVCIGLLYNMSSKFNVRNFS